MKKDSAPKKSIQNPALKPLEVLVDEWVIELSNAPFLPNPLDKLKGYASFESLENGGFIIMRQSDKLPGPPSASWLIGRDDSEQDYTILYFDSRGVSRKYEMSFSDGIWKIWRKSPGFWQRFEGKVNKAGNNISAYWEKSSDGKSWEHDFDITYSRVN